MQMQINRILKCSWSTASVSASIKTEVFVNFLVSSRCVLKMKSQQIHQKALKSTWMNKCPQFSMTWSNAVKKSGPKFVHSDVRDWESHMENDHCKLLLPKVFLHTLNGLCSVVLITTSFFTWLHIVSFCYSSHYLSFVSYSQNLVTEKHDSLHVPLFHGVWDVIGKETCSRKRTLKITDTQSGLSDAGTCVFNFSAPSSFNNSSYFSLLWLKL